MAEVERVFPDYDRKVQLQQFEPVKHGVELAVKVGDDEDPDEVYDEYSEMAEDMVERALAKRIAAKKLEDAEEDGDD